MENNFDDSLSEKIKKVEEIIKKYSPSEEGMQKIIMEAMNYSLLAGGKRLRPLIMYETYKMFRGNGADIEPFMAALEMIHTYSLIHDDLPAMDNDDYRRGRKTNHIVYGEDIAILAGDALLNYAFEVMTEAAVESKNPLACIKATNIIAKKAGIYGMIGGQTIDVKTEGQKSDMETVLKIHDLKTAALMEAAMMAGAVLAGAHDEQVRKAEKAANCLGIAFQIQDDILDVTSTSEMLGKPVLSDEKNDKTTYVSLVGVEKAKEDVKEYSNNATLILKGFGKDSDFLEELFIRLINRVR